MVLSSSNYEILGCELMNKKPILTACLALCLCWGLSALADLPEKPFSNGFHAGDECRADSLTGFDVQRYELSLALNDQTHFINGNVLATVLAEDALTLLQYNLVGLTVSSVLVNGATATYTHTGGIINISLNIPAGQTFTTQVFYSGTPQMSNDGYHIGMFFSTTHIHTLSDPYAARYWWPCYDYPWDKAIVDLHVTVRSDWKAACNGIRTGITDNGDGTSTTHWIGQNPMTTYLVCINCAAYMEINQMSGSVPIQSFVFPSQYNAALAAFASVPDMVDYFAQIFGPYPLEKYGQAVASMSTYGAMEHQTMTTMNPYYISTSPDAQETISHELAHQWFGDAVSFLTFKDVWLSEGFATYGNYLWLDKSAGWPSAVSYMGSSVHQYYMNWEGNNPRVIYDPDLMDYFSPPSYQKAAAVLHMLRLKIGDANFFQLLQDWSATYQDGNAITSEFQALAEQISGQDLEQFFQQWIFHAGIPELKYSVWTCPQSPHPLKIIARTLSNTSTQFQIEVPFRYESGNIMDSLYVHADPNGAVNLFSRVPDNDFTLIPNYDHWTLLRNSTELKPVLTQCLPSDSAVMLAWDAFTGDGPVLYNVCRRIQDSGAAWAVVNPQPLSTLSYVDTTVENSGSYEYCVRAVVSDGQQLWSSGISNVMTATPVAFYFGSGLLVVDETRDGTGVSINPDDAQVDDFYAYALSFMEFSTWDCATQGMPPLNVLGNYRVVLWHADDLAQNLLSDYQNTLGGYLFGGGKAIVSGWKTASVLSSAFLQNFSGNIGLVYDNQPLFLGADSDFYPEILVDPLKIVTAWNGMLPYVYTFTGVTQQLFLAEMGAGSEGNGNCAAFRFHDPTRGSDFILFGFPLYFMQAQGVSDFLGSIIPELLDPSSASDPSVPPVLPSLSAAPNPFSERTQLRCYLPAKGPASVRIYNLRGQLVREIAFAAKAIGTFSLEFDGRDASGNALPAGIYIARLETGGKVLTRKLSLVK